ncbi:hypothetical protein P389DRAFT_19661 [Cystobasidium minutum MCA 4210]|uniref:uncharacterized protein n=1 Tax=Cystobasidium minutum MCA 4210 TaxID=1397322 RepID=UPI0034CEC96F|eukprot:jgi/Rhomi1/19661/CE19660_382
MVSTCPCCSRERNSFVCRSCLTKLLKLYKTQASSHHSLLPAAQARASNGIKIAEKNRQLEAKYWSVKTETNTIQASIDGLSREIMAATDTAKKKYLDRTSETPKYSSSSSPLYIHSSRCKQRFVNH